MIITICGSTKFKDQINAKARQLTFEGHCVFKPEIFKHADSEIISEREVLLLTMIHAQKILQSDLIVVVTDEDCYIGNSTRAEIDFARSNKIEVNLDKFSKQEE